MITIGGLASGLNTNSIVNALMGVAQLPLTQLQSEEQNASAAQSDMSSFMSTLSSLQTAAEALSTPDGFSSLTATSSTSDASVSIVGASSPGSFSVQVQSLATEQRTQSTGQDSSTDALGQQGTLYIQVGKNGTPQPVGVSAGDSLASIAANINAQATGVTAAVTYDGSQYHLLVRGASTGAANAVTFTESGISLGLSNTKNTYQPAADATLFVDGFKITSPTNVVTNAVPGVALTLTGQSNAVGNVSIASDASSLANKVSAFVSAYNTVVAAAHTTAGYGTVAAMNPLLQGDNAVTGAMDQLSALVGGAVAGTSGTYTTLASVGITLQNDGTLALDQTKLENAIQSDPSDVEKLFVTDTSTASTGVMGALSDAVNSMTTGPDGLVKSRVDALGAEVTQYKTQEADLQTQLTTYQSSLQNEFAQLEVTMSNIKMQSAALTAMLSGTSGSSSSSSSSSSSGSGSAGFLSTGSSNSTG